MREVGPGTTRRLLKLVVADSRTGFVVGLALGVFGGIAELAGAAGIYPFLALLSHPELARTYPALTSLRAALGLVDDRLFMIVFGCACLAVFLTATVFMIVRQAYVTRYAMRQLAKTSTRLLENYLRRPYPYFLDQHSAELAKNVIAQSDAVTLGTLLPWMTLFSESFIIVGLTGLVLWMNPVTGLIAAVLLGGIAGLAMITLRNRVHQFGRVSDEANGTRFTFCLEALQSIKEIKAADAEGYFWRRFEHPAAVYARAFAEGNVAQILPSPMIQAAAMSAIMLLAIALIAGGRPPSEIVPLLSVYAVAGYRLMPSLSRSSVAYAQMRQYRAPFLHATDLLASAPESAPAPDASRTVEFRSRLELQGIAFSYAGPRGGKRVLHDVDLAVPHGAFVALAGGSGAGKTTLADIVLGLLTPESGRILVDGRELAAADMPAWRRRIGYIPQSVFLSDDTIAANVAFGVPEGDVDLEKVRECVRLARLDAFVAGLPQGLSTRVGERGALLSGGQRQRLAIARALYREPDLLVLDESTSALDGITEGELMESLAELRGRKTVIVIAHRPNTIRRADKIVLLKDGRVAAAGAYQDLLRQDPHFAALMSHPTA